MQMITSAVGGGGGGGARSDERAGSTERNETASSVRFAVSTRSAVGFRRRRCRGEACCAGGLGARHACPLCAPRLDTAPHRLWDLREVTKTARTARHSFHSRSVKTQQHLRREHKLSSPAHVQGATVHVKQRVISRGRSALSYHTIACP